MKQYMADQISDYMRKLMQASPQDIHPNTIPITECLEDVVSPWNAYMRCGTKGTGLGQLALAALVGSPAWQFAMARAEKGEYKTVDELLTDVFRRVATSTPTTQQGWEALWTQGNERRHQRVPKKYNGPGRPRRSRSPSRRPMTQAQLRALTGAE